MTFPCLVLGKGLPYTYIGVHTVESGTTAGAVAEATTELVSDFYGDAWKTEIRLYKVLLDLQFRGLF